MAAPRFFAPTTGNAAEVLQTAANLVAGDDSDDLEGAERGSRDVTVARDGGATVRIDARDVESHDVALVSALKDAPSDGTTTLGDCAVLTMSTSLAQTYRRVLQSAGVPVLDLEDYDGQTCERVKVGTVKRSKGLELKQVFRPRLHDAPPQQRVGELDAAYAERAALWRREVFVAMTRARDRLWLGYLAPDAKQASFHRPCAFLDCIACRRHGNSNNNELVDDIEVALAERAVRCSRAGRAGAPRRCTPTAPTLPSWVVPRRPAGFAPITSGRGPSPSAESQPSWAVRVNRRHDNCGGSRRSA